MKIFGSNRVETVLQTHFNETSTDLKTLGLAVDAIVPDPSVTLQSPDRVSGVDNDFPKLTSNYEKLRALGVVARSTRAIRTAATPMTIDEKFVKLFLEPNSGVDSIEFEEGSLAQPRSSADGIIHKVSERIVFEVPFDDVITCDVADLKLRAVEVPIYNGAETVNSLVAAKRTAQLRAAYHKIN